MLSAAFKATYILEAFDDSRKKVPKNVSSTFDNHVRLGGQKLETRACHIKFPMSYLGYSKKGLNPKSESSTINKLETV